MIGKGERNAAVVEAMERSGAVYLAAVGGAGAFLSGCVKNAEVIAYPELGPEAVRRLEVCELPCIVAIDSLGHSLYVEGRNKYAKSGGTA
jgi:fumarate hydratase subunit beta